MDGILITILIVTGFLIYKMISSSRKQEGYKRWKATDGSKEEKTTKVKWEHGAWLRHALGATVSRAQYVQKYDESAVVWCARSPMSISGHIHRKSKLRRLLTR